jgi:two-component system nitrogen regulation sensor histidine kinase NtrY
MEAIEARAKEQPAGYKGRIRVAVARDDERCIIAIHDNGRGLPAGPRDKLFEPYVTHRDKGTGLGLAIAQRIVTEHDGSLTLSDSPDGGACARVVLPAVHAEQLEPADGEESLAHGA